MDSLILWGGVGAGAVTLGGLLYLWWLAWSRGRDLTLLRAETASLRDSVASYAADRARLQIRVLKLEQLGQLREKEARRRDEEDAERDPAGALHSAWGRLGVHEDGHED